MQKRLNWLRRRLVWGSLVVANVECYFLARTHVDNKSSATADMADHGWKADLNWKLWTSNSQVNIFEGKSLTCKFELGLTRIYGIVLFNLCCPSFTLPLPLVPFDGTFIETSYCFLACLSSDPYVRLSLCSNTRDYVYCRKQTKTIKKVWISVIIVNKNVNLNGLFTGIKTEVR